MVHVSFHIFLQFSLRHIFLEHAHEGREDGFIADPDEMREVCPEVAGCFFQVVVRDLGEQMMRLGTVKKQIV